MYNVAAWRSVSAATDEATALNKFHSCNQESFSLCQYTAWLHTGPRAGRFSLPCEDARTENEISLVLLHGVLHECEWRQPQPPEMLERSAVHCAVTYVSPDKLLAWADSLSVCLSQLALSLSLSLSLCSRAVDYIIIVTQGIDWWRWRRPSIFIFFIINTLFSVLDAKKETAGTRARGGSRISERGVCGNQQWGKAKGVWGHAPLGNFFWKTDSKGLCFPARCDHFQCFIW